MDSETPPESPQLRTSIQAFLHVEHVVYIAIGALMSLTAVMAPGGAAADLWAGLTEWKTGTAIPLIIERLLFVLMIAEILHTVRVSIRSGSLTSEPFLVVGLIASIRRVLVITLESSEARQDKTWSVESEHLFRSSMIELGVVGMLIIVMVVSIYLLRRAGRGAGEAESGQG